MGVLHVGLKKEKGIRGGSRVKGGGGSPGGQNLKLRWVVSHPYNLAHMGTKNNNICMDCLHRCITYVISVMDA